MSDNIRVTVRVRPFIRREEAEGGSSSPTSHWELQDNSSLVQVDPASRRPLCTPYVFDAVFGPEVQTEDVYQEVAMPIVEAALSGFNGTIFVYGQTSSGKTYTMMGDRNNPGIIPLAVQNIYRSIEDTPDREYLIRASYMEIYNENISDLLAGRDSKNRSLAIREDQSGSVYVADLKEECANCEENLLVQVRRGEKNRHIGSTNMNERSSRSHTIFRIILESRERSDEEGGEGAVTVSHLNLVDLAGSENVSQSGATGERLKEGGFINKSLFMLGRVISQLSEGEPFVNFRDSKLTRILQLSLGGNAKTAIISTVTPAALEQTHSTLRFACRAKSIKNKPVVNEILSDAALLKRYAKEIKGLQATLAMERNTDKAQEVEQVREMLGEQARRNEELEAKIHELKTKLVVSSLPRRSPRRSLDKKRKARRETWCAPAIRTSRPSLGVALHLPPTIQEHHFIQPQLPPWAEESPCPERSLNFSAANLETSLSMEVFGGDDISFILNQAERAKGNEEDSLRFSPTHVNTKQRKRVKFDVAASPPSFTREASCQTDESLAPQMRLPPSVQPGTPESTPKSTPTRLPSTPSTPAHVLRARNHEMKEKLSEKEKWLDEWRQELDNLREFQRLEIQTLEESFEGRLAHAVDREDGGGNCEKGTEAASHLEEIKSLKRSLKDYEQLLMDANRELSHNIRNSTALQTQLEALSEEHIQLSTLQEVVVRQREETEALKKDAEVRECRLKELENERQDFDMMMELALKKQKQRETDLRRSLDDAWKEVAAYENGDMEEVRRRSQRLSELEKMAQQVTTAEEGNDEGSRAALQEGQEEMQQVANRLREELLQAFQEKEQLQQEVKDLQEHLSQVLSEHGDDRIKFLKEETEDLRARLKKAEQKQGEEEEKEGAEGMEVDMKSSSPSFMHVTSSGRSGGGRGEANTLSSQDFSRVLSETLQALEESVCIPPTPGRRSISSSIDALTFQDLEMARPVVETLKSGLMALQEYIQVMEQQQQEAAQATHYHLQVIAKAEEEMNTWKTQESFIGDYILHSPHSWRTEHHHHTMQQWAHHHHYPPSNIGVSHQNHLSPLSRETHSSTQPSSPSSPPSSFLHLPTSQTTTKEIVCRAVEEERKRLVEHYEAKLKDELAARAPTRHSSANTDTSYFSFTRGDTLTDVGSGEGPCDATQEMSFLSFNFPNNITKEKSDLETELLHLQEELSHRNITEEEVHCLRWQVDTLKEEKSGLEEELSFLQDEVERLAQKEDASMESPNKVQVAVEGICTDIIRGEDCTTPSPNQENKSSRDLGELQRRTEELQDAHKKIELLELEIKMVREAPPTDPGNFDDEGNDDKRDLQEKTKELQEAKEKIECLELEMKMVQEASPMDQGNHDNERSNVQSELQQKTKELKEAMEKIKLIELEREKIQEELSNVVVEKDTDLEMIIANFTDKEEAFEKTERKLRRVTTELEEMKGTLASRNQELERLQLKQQEELDRAAAQLEEMKETLASKCSELQKVNLELQEMKEASTSKDLDVQSFDKQLEDLHKVTIELEEVKETLSNKDFEVEEMKEALTKKDLELQRLIDEHQSLQEEMNQMVNHEAFSSLQQKLQQLQQEYAELEVESENKVLEAQKTAKNFEEKYKGCFQDYAAASKVCEENRLMFQKSEEEKEDLRLKHLEEQNNLNLKYKEDVQKAEYEMENLKLKYESDLQKSEEEKSNLKLECENELQKYKEENYKQQCDCELRQVATPKDPELKESLDLSVGSAMVGQKLDEIEALKDQLEERVKECKQLRDTIDNLKTVLARRQEEAQKASDEHQEELTFYMDSLKEKDKDLKNLENEAQRRRDEVASLTSTLSAKDQSLHSLEKDLHATQQNLKDKEAELETLSTTHAGKMQDLQEELDCMRKDYEEVCADRRSMSEALKKLNDKEVVFKKLSQTHTETSRRVEELQEGIDRLQQDYEEVCAEKRSMGEALEKLKDKEVELEKLSQTHTKTSRRVEELQEAIDRLHQDYEKVCAEKSSMGEALEKLKDKEVELEKLSQTHTKTSRRVEELQEAIDRLHQDYEKVCAEKRSMGEALEKLKDMEVELEKLSCTQMETLKRVEELQQAKNSLQQDYEEVCADRQGLREALERLKHKEVEVQTVASKRVQELQEELESLRKKYEELCADRSSMSEALEELKDKEVELQKLSCKEIEACKKVEELQEGMDRLQQDFENMCAEKRSMSEALEKLNDKEVELQKLSCTQTDASKRIQELQEGMSTLQNDYEEACTDRDSMSKTVKALEEDRETLSHKVASQNALLDNMEEDVLQMKDELKMQQNEMVQLQEVIMTLQADKDRLQEECSTQKTTSQEMEKLIGAIENYKCEMTKKEQQVLAMTEELECKTNRLAEMEKLAGNLQDATDRLEEKCKQLEEAEKRCEVLEQEIKEVKSLRAKAMRTEELMVMLSSAEDKISFFEERCTALEKEASEFRKQADTEKHESYEDINTLVNKLQQVEGENETLRKTLKEQQHTRDQETEAANVVELQCKVNELENELKVHKQRSNTTNTAENQNSVAHPSCEDCSNYKAMVGRLNEMVREKEQEYERKEDELVTRLNMSLKANDSFANVSTRESRRSRAVKLVEENESLQVQLRKYMGKVEDLEAALEILRRTNGVISQNPEMQRELMWMWDKMEYAERKLEILNRNYDLLERENEEMKELMDQQTEGQTLTSDAVVLQMKAELKALQERYKALEEKYSSLQEQYVALQGKAKLSVDSCISKGQYDALKMDHNKLQEVYTALQEDYDVLKTEHSTLKETCKALTEEQSILQKDLGTLQEKYNTLQETHNTLQETHRAIKGNHTLLEETDTVLQEEHKALVEKYSYARDRFNSLREKYNNLVETYKTSMDARQAEEQNSSTSRVEKYNSSVSSTPAGSLMMTPLGMGMNGAQEGVVEELREQLAASLRENNELKFRLSALDAPSKKLVESLKEELRITSGKVTHLKDELRRLQNSGHPDATICELTGHSSTSSSSSQQYAKREYDYSSGSGVVAQVQVVELQTKMYHLEKSKKKVEEELRVMEEHMKHYRNKAQEWKEKAVREERTGQRGREEVTRVKAELREQRTKTEELITQIERQQFELGHQREMILKLEKERKEGMHCTPYSASASTVTRAIPFTPEGKQGTDTPVSQEAVVTAAAGSRGLVGRIRGGMSTAGIGRGNATLLSATGREGGGGGFITPAAGGREIRTTGVDTKEGMGEEKDKHKEQQQEERLRSHLLGIHNAPLPTHTRTERLPWVKGVDVHAGEGVEGEAPLWQTFKENRDISKYKLPPEARRKADEKCQTQ